MAKASPSKSPAQQLASFLAKYDPKIASVARSALSKMRKRLPGALELVYDNYNALVIGICPTLRRSDAIFSIVLYPRYVTFFFLQGAGLPDPHHRLEGTASRVRRITLESATTLDDPEVVALMNTALHRAKFPLIQSSAGSSSLGRSRPSSVLAGPAK
ncbi:MAG TPA: hypothetical protein VEI55_05290 [Candidatus Acidoferrum sp.]|nr:hypothetical protein [Candidatus Acidoferrum sp.]